MSDEGVVYEEWWKTAEGELLATRLECQRLRRLVLGLTVQRDALKATVREGWYRQKRNAKRSAK